MHFPDRHAETVVHMLRRAAESAPASDAVVVVGRERTTYRELSDRVAAWAARIVAVCGAKNRIGILLPNGSHVVDALLGVLASGNQAVLLNPGYTARELTAILPDADMQAVITSEAQIAALQDAMCATALGPVVLNVDGATVRADPELVRKGLSFLPPAVEELALLQFTGGTTGKPKGVMLSHRALTMNICQRDALLPTRPGVERILCMTPIFHAYALAMAVFPALFSAGALVILPRYRPEAALSAIAEQRITLFAGTPTIYNGLVAHPEFRSTNFASLRGAFSGAAPLSVEVLTSWEQVAHVPIYEGYGLTEATAVLTFNPMIGKRKPGSVGVPLPGTEVQVVDVETGRVPQATGQVGEVRARGPQMMEGYRNRARDTAAILRDGWLYTGDIGVLDEDGYLFLRSRKSDMAIVSGYNVYPREIEEVLYLHPAVLEAIAVGLPDKYRGECIGALISLRPGAQTDADDLIAHCAKNLAKYKVPTMIEVAEQLPKTAAGKLDRQSARQVLLNRKVG